MLVCKELNKKSSPLAEFEMGSSPDPFGVRSTSLTNNFLSALTPLTRPLHSQVTVDPIAKDCPSEGFNVCQHFSPSFLHS